MCAFMPAQFWLHSRRQVGLKPPTLASFIREIPEKLKYSHSETLAPKTKNVVHAPGEGYRSSVVCPGWDFPSRRETCNKIRATIKRCQEKQHDRMLIPPLRDSWKLKREFPH